MLRKGWLKRLIELDEKDNQPWPTWLRETARVEASHEGTTSQFNDGLSLGAPAAITGIDIVDGCVLGHRACDCVLEAMDYLHADRMRYRRVLERIVAELTADDDYLGLVEMAQRALDGQD